MSCPTENHWKAALNVLRYLAHTRTRGLVYTGTSAPPTLSAYSDASYAHDIDTRRSTTGYAFLLHGAVVSWSTRLQPTVAVSTAEAEFQAAAATTKEALWFWKLLTDLEFPSGRLTIMCDNQVSCPGSPSKLCCVYEEQAY